MKRSSLASFVVTAALVSLTAVGSALAIERGPDGYFHTGDGIRVKSIAFLKIKIYAIGHDMRELPPTKSKQAVIDADVDKHTRPRWIRSWARFEGGSRRTTTSSSRTRRTPK